MNYLPRLLRGAEQPRLERATCQLQVRRPTHNATTPHNYVIINICKKYLKIQYHDLHVLTQYKCHLMLNVTWILVCIIERRLVDSSTDGYCMGQQANLLCHIIC